MGFHEDDRIRNKNARLQKACKSNYSLTIDKGVSVNSVIEALRNHGFDVEHTEGVIKITD